MARAVAGAGLAQADPSEGRVDLVTTHRRGPDKCAGAGGDKPAGDS